MIKLKIIEVKLYFKVFNNLISHEYQSSVFESEYFLSPKVTKTKRIHINKTLRVKKEATKSKKELLQIQANLIAAWDVHSLRPRCAYFGELL